jgi:hypothetical protein
LQWPKCTLKEKEPSLFKQNPDDSLEAIDSIRGNRRKEREAEKDEMDRLRAEESVANKRTWELR